MVVAVVVRVSVAMVVVVGGERRRGVCPGSGRCTPEAVGDAELEDGGHLELAADGVGDEGELDGEVEAEVISGGPRGGGAGEEIEAAAVAVVGVDGAGPALGGLGLGLEAGAHGESTAETAAGDEAAGVAIASLVALVVLVDGLLGEGEGADAPSLPAARHLEGEDRVEGAGAHLDVLVRDAHAAEAERIFLGAADRDGEAGAGGEAPGGAGAGCGEEERGIGEAAHRLITVVDPGIDELDLVARAIEVADRGVDHAHWQQGGEGEERREAEVEGEAGLADQEVLVVDDGDGAAAEHELAIIVLGLDVGAEPREAQLCVSGADGLVCDLPDREGWVASAGAGAAGEGGAWRERGTEEGEAGAEEERETHRARMYPIPIRFGASPRRLGVPRILTSEEVPDGAGLSFEALYDAAMSGRAPYLVFAACLGAAVGLLVHRFGVMPLRWDSPLARIFEIGAAILVAVSWQVMRHVQPKRWPWGAMAGVVVASGGAVALISSLLIPRGGGSADGLTPTKLPGMSLSLPAGVEKRKTVGYATGELVLAEVASKSGVLSVRWLPGAVNDEEVEIVAKLAEESVQGTERRIEKWKGPSGADVPTIVLRTAGGPMATSLVGCGLRRIAITSVGAELMKTVHQQVLASFVCAPEAAREAELQGMPWILVADGWRALDETGATYTDGTNLVTVVRTPAGLDKDGLRTLVAGVIAANGGQAVVDDAEGDRFPLEVKEGANTFTGWVSPVKCPTGEVAVLALVEDPAALAALTETVTKQGRCLKVGEARPAAAKP